MELNDIIKFKVIKLFVNGEVDLNAPAVKAALMTVASEMSLATDIIGVEDTLSTLNPIFNPKEDQNITDLVGMNPNYVKANIGYAVDFRDYSASMAAYQSQKAQFDELYYDIKSQYMLNQQNMTK